MFKRNITINSTICHIQIVCLGRIFGSQGVYLFDNGKDAHLFSHVTHFQHCFVHIPYLVFQSNSTGYLEISESIDLCLTKHRFCKCLSITFLQCFININDMFQFVEEPLVNLCQFMDSLDIILRQMHCFRNNKDTLVRRLSKCCINIFNFKDFILYKTMHSLSNHTKSFLNSLLKSTTYRHDLAYRLHRRAQFFIHTTELREVPAGNLTDHVVESRLKEC